MITMNIGSNIKFNINMLRAIPAGFATAVRRQTRNGACKHDPGNKKSRLIRNRSTSHTMSPGEHNPRQDQVQLEISLGRLEALFNKGVLCAADVHCLNCASKTCIWNLCLSVCAKRMQCGRINPGLYTNCKQHKENLPVDFPLQVSLKREHLEHIPLPKTHSGNTTADN
jgi:hypothetical protein